MKSNKEFAELIERKVRQTIKKNNLLYKRQKIGVGVSGGKDSLSTLYILKTLGYDVEAFIVDHGIGEYARTNLENTKKLCKKLKVILNIISIEKIFGRNIPTIKKELDKQGFDYSYCMICGILKRYLLNKTAQEHSLDVIVTGHNLDDESQAFIMNVFRNDFKLASRQGPKPGIIESNKFVKRVKPMFFVAEEDINKYSQIKKLPVNYEACPYSKSSYRHDFKKMLNKFEERNPSIKYNIVHFQQKMKSMLNIESFPEIGTCSECGEPSSREICKTCELVKKLLS